MSLAYFDTSALLKLFLPETGSTTVRQIWKVSTHPVAGRLTFAEARAVLAAAERAPQRQFDSRDHERAKQVLESIWRRMVKINITDAIVRAAGELAEQYALRGYDAVHLACARQASVDAMVCSDRALLAAARDCGIGIADVSR